MKNKYVTGKEELWRNINMREVHFPGRSDLYCLQLVLGRAWEYMEIPLSGGKVRRWNFFTDLYHSGIDLRIFYDRGRDSSGTV